MNKTKIKINNFMLDYTVKSSQLLLCEAPNRYRGAIIHEFPEIHVTHLHKSEGEMARYFLSKTNKRMKKNRSSQIQASIKIQKTQAWAEYLS